MTGPVFDHLVCTLCDRWLWPVLTVPAGLHPLMVQDVAGRFGSIHTALAHPRTFHDGAGLDAEAFIAQAAGLLKPHGLVPADVEAVGRVQHLITFGMAGEEFSERLTAMIAGLSSDARLLSTGLSAVIALGLR